jgi:glycine oxidase
MARDHEKRVAVIGGGVIGLSLGWRLAAAGCKVTVFDSSGAGRGATWAAAGMLAAGSEVEPGEEALFRLLSRSQSMWPEFAAEIEGASGIDIHLRREGTLTVALTPDDAGRLRQVHALQNRVGVVCSWLSRDEALELEPRLNPRLVAAVLVPGDHQVDNRLLADGLKASFLAAGGELREHFGNVGVSVSGDRVGGVDTNNGFFPAEIVVVAAGAWSPLVPGLPAAATPPVRPVKGQMLALAMDPAAPMLRHVLWTSKAYMVPRLDGRLIVGATTEERGFDPAVTAGGMLSLLESAWRALPGIEELPIVETWSGFRPGSRDDAPILGGTAISGLILATGHHRNGILLAPVTAKAITELVLTGEIEPVAAPFGLERFQRSFAERTQQWISH